LTGLSGYLSADQADVAQHNKAPAANSGAKYFSKGIARLLGLSNAVLGASFSV
jgi:hypothetical protein